MNIQDYTNFIKETMHLQPLENIGMTGHVANGKSFLVSNISGEATQRHSDERKKNITIKLGYANAKIFKCPKCPRPECYQSTSSDVMNHFCRLCAEKCELKKHVSFADCPGHALLMQTMLNGTCVMDHTILVESASNVKIPELQTMEHFEIANEANIPTMMVCVNKLDLLFKTKEKAKDIVQRMENFINANSSQNRKIPVIPISASHDINIDVVLEYICNSETPVKNLTKDFKMLVIRSFNVNKEKTKISDLKGGVIGGSLLDGMIELNDEVIIYPGYVKKNNKDTWTCHPLKSKVLSINSGKNELKYAVPGGLIGIQMEIDPSFTGDDKLIGNVIYNKSRTNVKVYETITLKYKKLTRKLTEFFMEYCDKPDIKEVMQINVNSNNIMAKIKKIDSESIELVLEFPICLEIGETVTISKINNGHIDIFGRGIFNSGVECQVVF